MAEKKDEKKKTTVAKAAAKKTTAAKKATRPVKRAVARPVTRAVVRPAPKPAVAKREGEEPAAPVPKSKAGPRPLPTAPAGKAPFIGLDGAVSGSVPLPDVFAQAKRRAGVLFQALTAAASNARQGTSATKNRSRVRGGGAKPWRQKGTGRARQGSTRAPHWRHGGVVFGPNGRRYKQRIPEKMRREAFAEAFAARAGAGRVIVFEGLSFPDERPRTKAVLEWIGKIGDTGSTVLVTPEVDEQVARATANAGHASLRSVGALSTYDLLTHDTVLVRRDALEPLAARATNRSERGSGSAGPSEFEGEAHRAGLGST